MSFVSGFAQAAPAPDRAARIAERYRALLNANPVEGMALDQLWKYHETNGTVAALVEDYRQANEAPGASAATALVYGHLLKRTGRLDEAVKSYGDAAGREPGNPLPKTALADLASKRGEADGAAALYAEAIKLTPAGDRKRPELLLKQGGALLAAGKSDEAAACWEQIVALNPADLVVRRQLAQTYENSGLRDRAIAHYEFIEAHAGTAERVAALRELGRLQEARGQFDAARDALERGLKLTSRDNWLHGELQGQLIRLYQRAGRAPELMARWREAAANAPGDLAAYYQQAALAEAQGDTAAEREAREKIASLAPNERENNLRLAVRYTDAGDLTRAADLYDRMLRSQPDNLNLLIARADLEVQVGKLMDATNRLEVLPGRNPSDESVANAVLAFFLSHHLDAAAERLLRAEMTRQPVAAEPALAMAKFLMARRRIADASAVLETFTALPGEPAAMAARDGQAAEVYKENGLREAALRCWNQAAKLRPEDPAPLLAAAEIQRASGEFSSAVQTLERAVSIAAPGPARIDVERKLFETLKSVEGQDASAPRDESLIQGLPGPTARVAINPELGRYLAKLDASARAQPSLEVYLQLGRWYSWAHDPAKVVEAASSALSLDQGNLPARELIALAATELHQDELAGKTWDEILALDPKREVAVLRQLAKLKLQAGDNEGSLQLFRKLQEVDPGSRAALVDLAFAQQRMDRWFDALATWERAYNLPGASSAQRADIRRSLLAVYDHLAQPDKALDLLLGAIDEQTEASVQEDLFRQVSDLAFEHSLGSQLRDKLEARLQRKPDDYLTLTALAQCKRDEGDPEEAYRLLQRARYSSPDPARSLPVLVREGQALGEIDQAVQNQKQLVALPGQFTADNLQTLASLQEEARDEGAATATWNSLVARFPRDPAALGKASLYFERIEQIPRARDLQRQVVALDDSDLQRTMRLAALDARGGDRAEAAADYETILLRTAPETPGDSLVLPDELLPPSGPTFTSFPGISRSRYRTPGPVGRTAPVVSKPVSGDRLIRLQAIRELSQLKFAAVENSPAVAEAKRAWLERWQKAASDGLRTEPLQAFYAAGQGSLTMNLLSRWLAQAKSEDPVLRPAFLAAGLRLGEFQTVGDWACADTPRDTREARINGLVSALDQFLTTGGRPGPEMVAKLFPVGSEGNDGLWDVAREFAALHWYTQASELGQRLLRHASVESTSNAADVVEWELYGGSVEKARDIAKTATETGAGWTFEPTASPVFAALRKYYLLLPEAGRPPFVASYLRTVQARGSAIHATLSGILLHGLEGDDAAAQRDLETLVGMRVLASESDAPSSDARRWKYLLVNGIQLQNWGLDSLAASLWRLALRQATAFDERFGDGDGTVAEMRRRLLCAEVALAADPEDARVAVAAWLDSAPAPGLAASVAGELMNSSRYAAPARIDEYLCRIQPGDGEHWRSLFAVYERMGDYDLLEQTLQNLLTGSHALPEGLPRADFVCRWAAVRERNGDRDGACRILEAERGNLPGLLPVLIQLAQTQERAQRYDLAAATWREVLPIFPGPLAVLGLADALEKQGQRAEAITQLRSALGSNGDSGQNEIAARLAALYLADGKVEDTHTFAQSLLREGKFEALLNIASALGNSDQGPLARKLLTAALGRTRDSGVRFRLQQALLGMLSTTGDQRRDLLRAIAQLETSVRESPALRNNWETIRYKAARQAGADDWLEDELRRLWNGGKGDFLAGERLATFYMDTRQDERLRDTIVEFDHRPLLPDQLLFGLENALLRVGQAAFALPISERLCRRFPQNTDYALARATVLSKSGRQDAAKTVLDKVLAQAALRDDLPERVALFYLSLGANEPAMRCFEQVVRRDPLAVRSPGSFLQLARLYRLAGREAEAEALLRVAYRQDACDDFRPLVDHLAASGQLDGDKALEMPAADFPLSFRRRAALLASVSEFLKAAGRTEIARRLWIAHPEYLAGAGAAAAELAHDTPVEQLPEVITALRVAANQFSMPVPRLVRALDEAGVRSNQRMARADVQ